MHNLNEAMEQEKRLLRVIEDFNESLYNETLFNLSPPHGATKINSFCTAVSLSAIKDNGWSLSAATYTPCEQANAVKKKINGLTTVTTIIAAIKEMVESKCVQLSNERVPLNAVSVEALRGVLINIKEGE